MGKAHMFLGTSRCVNPKFHLTKFRQGRPKGVRQTVAYLWGEFHLRESDADLIDCPTTHTQKST